LIFAILNARNNEVDLHNRIGLDVMLMVLLYPDLQASWLDDKFLHQYWFAGLPGW